MGLRMTGSELLNHHNVLLPISYSLTDSNASVFFSDNLKADQIENRVCFSVYQKSLAEERGVASRAFLRLLTSSSQCLTSPDATFKLGREQSPPRLPSLSLI